MSLRIGIVEQPETTPIWPQIAAFLEPAREMGELPRLIGEHELCWCVFDDPELLAVATARLTVKREVEIVLVGGLEHGRWLGALDDMLGRWARDEGATALIACGRKGWSRVLGWQVVGNQGAFTAYRRELRDSDVKEKQGHH